jgi:hypothetical protein
MAQAKIRIMPGKKSGLASAPVFNAPQATAQSFEVGAPVKLASGALTAVSTTASLGASSALTVVKKSSTSNVIGFSGGDAQASSTNALLVDRMTTGMAFTGHVINGVASSAKLATTNIGDNVVLAKVTSGDTHWGFANDASSTFSSYASLVKGRVVELVDAASTVNGRILVEITKGGLLSPF